MRLYLMRLGRIGGTDVPVPGYLIRTDDGANIVVDTGFPRDRSRLPERSRNSFAVAPGESVTEQLAAIGVAPRDVRYVVLTHLDIDHAGCNPDFPDAEFVVQRRHYEAARAGLPRLQALRPYWDRPELRYRLIDGDAELVPGVELVETSGHVVGHQSVLVRLPGTGPVLLAGDAICRRAHLDPETRPIEHYDDDPAATVASTRKLLDLARREDVRFLVMGHDRHQWAGLKLAPEWYG